MTGTMPPQEFQEQLARQIAAGPSDHALRGPVARDTARGQRLLRRRRLAAAGATALVFGVAGAGVALALPATGPHAGPDRGLTAAQGPSREQDLLRSCREGDQSRAQDDAMFGSGDPTVVVAERTAYQVLLALRSADGAYWAECFVHLLPGEFRSGVEAFSTQGETSDFGYGAGPGCGQPRGQGETGCATFQVSLVDRRPAAVASVEVVLANGETTRLRTHDGYFVLNYLGPLPDGSELTPDGKLPPKFRPISRITFLDDSGAPIAAQAMDGSGTGEDHETVGDLPTLGAFPSLRGEAPARP